MKLPAHLLLAMALVAPSVALADGSVSLVEFSEELSPSPIAEVAEHQAHSPEIEPSAEVAAELPGLVVVDPVAAGLGHRADLRLKKCRMG